MKLKRNAYRTYIKVAGGAEFELIGKGVDDMSVEMNGSFEQTRDVTGEVTVQDEGYQPQLSVEPYYANPEDSIYDFMLDLAMNRKSGDDAVATILEVVIEDDSASSHKAWQEDVKIEIASYGGDTKGMQIPFNVWFNGNRQEGTVSYTEKKPTFTPNSSL